MKPADGKQADGANLIRQEVELIESGLQMQSQGLELLLAEMRALAGLIPGATPPVDARTAAETDAETEAGFDNMPV
jgi:hypothetical protein